MIAGFEQLRTHVEASGDAAHRALLAELDRLAAELAAERAKVQRLIDAFTFEGRRGRRTSFHDDELVDDVVAAALNGVS